MKRLVVLLALAAGVLAAAAPARAQALPNQVLALYPRQAGEVVFVDVRALRGSPHYARLKAQVMPERFRQLEQFAQLLGIDFEGEVNQLSWAFIGVPESAEMVGVAEGRFSAAAAEREAKRLGLAATRAGRAPVITVGRNDQGQDFQIAIVDGLTMLYGFRSALEPMLERYQQGGENLLDNAAMRALVAEVNGRSPLWLALDTQYTALALRQMVPEASRVSGFDTLLGRLLSATMRFELAENLRGLAAVRCQSGADALLFSTVVQAAVTYQSYRVGESNPELARVLKDLQVNRQEERLDLEIAIRGPDLVALLQRNTFQLSF